MTRSVTAGASFPIARLRARGARVGHLLGHWPAVGTWGLTVSLPPGVETPDRWTARSRATLYGDTRQSNVVIVQGSAQRGDQRPTPADIADTAAAVVELLDKLATHVETSSEFERCPLELGHCDDPDQSDPARHCCGSAGA